MSICQTTVPLGSGIGTSVLPTIAVHTGFAAVYDVLVAACTLTAVLTWLWVHDTPDTMNVVAQAAPPGDTDSLRNPTLLRMALATRLLCVPQGTMVAFATVFLRDFVHTNVPILSPTMAVVQGGAAVTRMWSRRWTDRHGNRRVYLLACARLSVALFVGLVDVAWMTSALSIDLSVTRVALVATVAADGTCVSAWHGVSYTEPATLIGTQRAGTASGLGNTGASTVLGLTSPCLPQVLTWSSWPVV